MALEDFTGYTELDPNSRIAVSANLLDVNGILNNEDARVHDDKGASHFGATFEHDVKVVRRSGPSTATFGPAYWAVSNVVDDCDYWDDNSSQAVRGYLEKYFTFFKFGLKDAETGDNDQGASKSGTITRYLTFERTSETALECRIYTDAGRESLEDTLAITITNGRRYQHVFGCSSHNGGSASSTTLDVEDLDLNEAVVPIEVAGTVAAQSATAAALEVMEVLEVAGAASAQSVFSSSVERTSNLAGQVGHPKKAISTVSGILGLVEPTITGTIQVQSSLAGILGIEFLASGTVAAAAAISSPGLQPYDFRGDVAGVGAVSGAIEVLRESKALVEGTSAVSGGVIATWEIASTIAAVAALSASTTEGVSLVGAIAGQSALSAWLVPSLSGVIAAVSETSALLSKETSLGPGAVAGQSSVGEPILIRFWKPYLSLATPGGDTRRLAWDTEETVIVVLDGEEYQRVPGGLINLSNAHIIRQYIDILDEMPATRKSPYDYVSLSWTTDAYRFEVWRHPEGGAWARLATIEAQQYSNGPLTDGLWHYKVIAVDEEGDETPSPIESIDISSAPEPPSRLAFSWDSGAGLLTLTWAASSSDDVDVYRVRSSAGAERLDLEGAPVQEGTGLSYTQYFTNETGMYIFSVRTVDDEGNEEANIAQALAIPFVDGAPASRPSVPRWVKAEAHSEGKIEVSWLYDPHFEYLGPGAAYEARIYWDNATGTIDYSSPKATVAMSSPTSAERGSWTSEVLTDGQAYLFAVRIASVAHPAGIETQNTDEHAATPDSTAPTAPDLTATVV